MGAGGPAGGKGGRGGGASSNFMSDSYFSHFTAKLGLCDSLSVARVRLQTDLFVKGP